MRKYDKAAVMAQLQAEALNTQESVNKYYVEVTAAERLRIFDLGYECALRDYKVGPFASDGVKVQ